MGIPPPDLTANPIKSPIIIRANIGASLLIIMTTRISTNVKAINVVSWCTPDIIANPCLIYNAYIDCSKFLKLLKKKTI